MSNFKPKNAFDVQVDEEFGITEAVATLDNGDFGSRTIRFETGQLARQADGSVTTYLDEETMLLATTTASNQPREGFDFFPLTVHYQEKFSAAGRIPGGATVERPVPSGFNQGNTLTLNLNRPDFTTAKNIVDQINDLLGPGVAQALDGGSISVTAPLDPSQRVDYLSILENLEVEVGQAVAKVIINSRTGTIVIGQNVRVQPAAVTHGSLTVTITEDPQVSQPEPFSDGQTVVVPNSKVKAEEEAKPMFKFGPGTTLDEIVRAVNQVGAAPSDLMAILEALKQAGALQADLIVI